MAQPTVETVEVPLVEKPSLESSRTSSELFSEDEMLLEAQPTAPEPTNTPLEYTVPFAKKISYLALYFVLNLSLTLLNKSILQQLSTPWLLTVMHSTATFIGCSVLVVTGRLELSKLDNRQMLVMVAFSMLFTLNIAISNVSLAMVSVPFHQIMRASCPAVTLLIYRTIFSRTYATQTYLSIIPLILGVAIATMGEMTVTPLGFILTALGVLLAATKTVVTNQLMTGSYKLPAMELLFRLTPLAAIQCLGYAAISGEFSKIGPAVSSGDVTFGFLAIVVVNAAMAFFLNTVSFQTNKLAGALTMTVAANVKQCITILLGIVLFNVQVTLVNAVGMLIAISGAAWYSSAELQNKGKK